MKNKPENTKYVFQLQPNILYSFVQCPEHTSANVVGKKLGDPLSGSGSNNLTHIYVTNETCFRCAGVRGDKRITMEQVRQEIMDALIYDPVIHEDPL